jgi:hypothetical protein
MLWQLAMLAAIRREGQSRINTPLGFCGPIFLEMRHAAAPAFKRTYVGQCANQSHVLSAAWAQRQLRLRAFSIYEEARFSAMHARLHWLHLLVEHSLAVVEAREHTTQTSAKKKTDGTLNHYNEWPPVSSPRAAMSVTSAQTWVARPRSLQVACAKSPIVSFRGCRQSGKASKTVNSCVALLRVRRTCS